MVIKSGYCWRKLDDDHLVFQKLTSRETAFDLGFLRTNFQRKYVEIPLFTTLESDTVTRFEIVVIQNLNIIDFELVRTTRIVWFWWVTQSISIMINNCEIIVIARKARPFMFIGFKC